MLCAAPEIAGASFWPAAGGGPLRGGAQGVEPGSLPASVAWSFASEGVRTPPIVTGGDGPFAQRVAYGTADGRVRLRVLATGEEVGSATVASAPVTDQETALSSAFASSSSETAPGQLYVVHDDGGGVEVARFDEATGARLGADVSVPGSLGCTELGDPLLTPVAADGTRLLFFTIEGSCPAGDGLVRFGVLASGDLVSGTVAPVTAITAADPALVVAGEQIYVAVGRLGGVDFRRATAAASAPPDATLALDGAQEPVDLASPGEGLYVLARTANDARVLRIGFSGAAATVAGSVAVAGAPAGLALGERIAVATSAGLTILQPDLAVVGTSQGAASSPSIAGEYAFVSGRAVRLADATSTPLPGAIEVAPAIARGFIVFGSGALATTDVIPPAVELAPDGRAAVVADDRGVAEVSFAVGRRSVPARLLGSPWAPARYTSQLPLAPGRNQVKLLATDVAGNTASATAAVRVSCQRTVRGHRRADTLRGRKGRDCLIGRGGNDRFVVRGRGADRVDCGPGRDVVTADLFDRIADDCDRVRRPRP